MDRSTVDKCLELIARSPSITTVDITGGAPELNVNFRYFVDAIRQLKSREIDIIDRCNLTVMREPGQETLPKYLADNRVHVIASLPCYGEKNVDQQRGQGVFERSISALLMLNDLGYGTPGTGLELDLVYNPIGPFLPPDQHKLEIQYKQELDNKFGIQFNKLFCITNMPIKRFADFLHRRGELKDYMDLLVQNFNASTVDSVMCRDTISVKYDGTLFDCDFNQQLGMAIEGNKRRLTVFDIQNTDELTSKKITTGSHCFGCTAGRGSSCQGVVA
jgi:radical SAM/Cys-rich protein